MMHSEKLNRIFSSKAFYIIFALLVSIVLWAYVEMTDPQDLDVTIDRVPIVFLNEDVLHGRNLVKSSVMPEYLSLTFECRRIDAARLRNVHVTVDLRVITSPGNIQLPFTVIYPPDVNRRSVSLISSSVENIELTVDRLFERTVRVEGVYTGGTASPDLMAGTPQFVPETITIFGPEALVSRVDRAWVPILRENLSTTYVDELEFILQDIHGAEIEPELYDALTFSHERVRVTVPIMTLKDVTLDVNLVPGAGASQANTRVTINPAKITVSGDPSVVADFNNITLGTIDLTAFDLSTAETFPIVIPNNVINESGEMEALVTVEVLGLEVGYFIVSNLHVVNVPRGYTATVINQSVVVRIRGSREDLATITPMNIRVVADLSDFSPGAGVVPARVFIDGVAGAVGAVGDYRLTVRLDADGGAGT